MRIKFKRINKGKYKYELTEKYSCKVNIPKNISAEIPGFIIIFRGIITIYPVYQWDGATGINGIYPNKWVLAGSLPHDAGYQCMREKKLDKKYRVTFDNLLYDDFIQDGMPRALAIPSIGVVKAVGWIFI